MRGDGSRGKRPTEGMAQEGHGCSVAYGGDHRGAMRGILEGRGAQRECGDEGKLTDMEGTREGGGT
jgi:hypothetical protein